MKAFANRTSRRTPALDSISLERASLAVADSAMNRRSRPLSGIFDGAAYLENNLREAATGRTIARTEPQYFEERHVRRETPANIDDNLANANPRATFNLKQSQIQKSQGAPLARSGFGTTSNAIEPTLTSTSVSVSDRSKRSAGSEGRPQQVESPAGRRAASLTTDIQQTPAALSLGEGLSSNANASSDLYMARKRVTANLQRFTERNGLATRQSRLVANAANAGIESESGYKFKNNPTSPANGGAYLRLQETEVSPSMTIALKPIHTHTLDPSMYNFDSATDQHHNVEMTNVAQAQAGPATTSKKSAAIDNTSVASPAHQERLSDHVRYRDHHGRVDERSSSHGVNDHHDVRNGDRDLVDHARDVHRYELRPDHTDEKNHDFVVDRTQDVAIVERNSRYKLRHPSHALTGEGSWTNAASCIAIIASIMLFASISTSASLSTTLLILALVCPLQTSDEKDASPVQCTTKNSSWLQELLPHKGFSAHKLAAKVQGAGTANGVWLRGLMYPHEMASLQSVRV